MDEYFSKAADAYRRHCERNGHLYAEPAESLSEVDDKQVVLRNANGELARFKMTGLGRVRRVDA